MKYMTDISGAHESAILPPDDHSRDGADTDAPLHDLSWSYRALLRYP
jgi:hypothetical protein